MSLYVSKRMTRILVYRLSIYFVVCKGKYVSKYTVHQFKTKLNRKKHSLSAQFR